MKKRKVILVNDNDLIDWWLIKTMQFSNRLISSFQSLDEILKLAWLSLDLLILASGVVESAGNSYVNHHTVIDSGVYGRCHYWDQGPSRWKWLTLTLDDYNGGSVYSRDMVLMLEAIDCEALYIWMGQKRTYIQYDCMSECGHSFAVYSKYVSFKE